jgi:hypothetical protein
MDPRVWPKSMPILALNNLNIQDFSSAGGICIKDTLTQPNRIQQANIL